MNKFLLLLIIGILASVLIWFIAFAFVIALPYSIIPSGACVSMNGNEIRPDPELCNYACNGRMDSPHMQAHLDEVCDCCKSKWIDYSGAGEYKPRVYVVNPDGSRGEDRTCAYYPDAAGCPEVKD